ncbi:hypothetical protein I350_05369 [Cryptococcus amylolentus CBS 6273]|uniref:Uncharacterized protein n=1 Tax=Cryptococcus amylolentus CBS 6273 TaxID=1296118 RepID=A0A1E3JV99_9TREE|nr:hypothetical protein I350_05369 [Cryptococcus amylolentus CBS 6273]
MGGSFNSWLAKRRSKSASHISAPPQQPKSNMSTTVSPRSTTTSQLPSPTSAYLPAPEAPSTSHSPIADSFLDAKAQNARRMSQYDAARGTWTPGSSSTPQASLTAVMESTNGAPPSGSNTSSPPPSAYKAGEKRTSPRPDSRRSGGSDSDEGMLTMDKRRSTEKGKGREISAGGLGGIPEEPHNSVSAPWVLDPSEMELGSWSTASRVVLVLGDPTVESIEPLLSNPAFANTALLIGTYKPVAAIEDLLSPSHLMSQSTRREIYPTLYTFQPSVGKNDTEAQAFAILIDKAVSLAKQFRARSPAPTRSRHASFDSTNSNSSNTSPGMRTRVMSGLGISTGSRRASYESGNLTRPAFSTSIPNLPKTMSTQSLRSESSARSSRNRLSTAFNGMIRSESEAKDAPHLFDAVVNFIPSPGPKKALRDLIHQASIVTTGVLPLLARLLGKGSGDDRSVLPVTLLHVLPSRSPTTLPFILETFVLSLLPNFQGRCARELFGCVVPLSVWRAPLVNMSSSVLHDVSVSGAEVLLAGGVRCPTRVVAGHGAKMKGRVYLPSWDCCMTMTGMIAESRRPSLASSRSGSRAVSRQPSPGDSSSSEQLATLPPPPPVVASPLSTLGPVPVSPRSTMLSPPLSPSQPKRRSMLSTVAAAAEPPVSPPTPDLDPSASSCSSSFALGETNSQGSNNAAVIASLETTPRSSGGLVNAESLAVPNEGKMKKMGSRSNLAGWLRRKSKSALA